MFNFLKNLFASDAEIDDFFVETQGDNSMASIRELSTGYGLFDRNDTMIQRYSRRRDAVRGATRRGLVVA